MRMIVEQLGIQEFGERAGDSVDSYEATFR